jgi:hypothetical protein
MRIFSTHTDITIRKTEALKMAKAKFHSQNPGLNKGNTLHKFGYQDGPFTFYIGIGNGNKKGFYIVTLPGVVTT